MFLHFLRILDSSPLGLLWFALLIDCFINTELKGPQKLWWIFFILVTQFFGAVIYFFLGPSQILRRITGKKRQQQPAQQNPRAQTVYYVPRQPNPEQYALYASDAPVGYEQGYRAQESPTPAATQEACSSDAFYEQPQAMYPEMTQEQKM